MHPQAMTLEQIREQGLATLRQQLGIVGMVRCLQQSEMGWGNYTEERYQWLGDPDLEALGKKSKRATQTRKTDHEPDADGLQTPRVPRSRFLTRPSARLASCIIGRAFNAWVRASDTAEGPDEPWTASLPIPSGRIPSGVIVRRCALNLGQTSVRERAGRVAVVP
jgi:hypothetical protein